MTADKAGDGGAACRIEADPAGLMRTRRGDDYAAPADGSWARATATGFLGSPTVHQGGPRRLWRELQRIRNRLNRTGTLPVYGARATITPDGTTTLSRGGWNATL